MLALIVRDSTGIDAASANSGLKRWREPFLQRIGWLYIVVAVEQNSRSFGANVIFPKDHRPAAGRQNLYCQLHLAHHLGHIVCDLSNAFSIGANAWVAQVVEQA